ncbi:MAG: endonuclease/exonuclease/phosphatase family protein [Pyrinomonadaceae bacterium]
MPQPHIIALQEADHGTIRAGRRHVARELAERLGYHYVHAPAETPRHEEQKRKQWYLDFEEHIRIDEPGDTGMAILSALPFASAGRIELPSFGCPWRPKLAQQARFSLGDKRHFSIFNAHIDPHASVDQQLVQHEAILDLAGQLSADEPTLLLGDFNTLSPEARVRLRTLLESHGYETPMPTGIATWRAGLYRLHADWIFARNIRTIVRWGIASSAERFGSLACVDGD